MKKRTNLKTWLVMVVLLAVLPGSVWATGTYEDGDGSPGNPFQINTPAQMDEIGQHSEDWGSYFILTADIDLAGYTGTSFHIIGSTGTPFTGSFDGNDLTISNFTYTSTGVNYIGLFGWVNGGEIKDLGLIDVDAGPGDYVGGLVGGNVGTVSNCYATGNVSGDWYVGGLVGYNVSGGTISNSYATGNVSGDWYVGGLVGVNSSTISNCYATGSITGTGNSVGGLVGWNSGTVSNCYAAGDVSGDYDVGGLVGCRWEGSYTSCFWDIDVNPLLTGVGNTTDPPDVMGRTTVQMQTESTFTDYGWDFVGETANGTEDIWVMFGDGLDYPRLAWENSIPVADSGDNQTVFAWVDGMATVKLDGSGSYDADGDDLEYFWFEGDEQIAAGVDPNVELAVGEHTIELIVSDGQEDSEPNAVVITVIEPIEVTKLRIMPRTLNLQSKGVITVFIELPESYSVEDIDLETVECEGAGAIRGTIANDTLIVKFERRDLQDIEPGQEVEFLVTGELADGTVFEGTDVIRVIDKGGKK